MGGRARFEELLSALGRGLAGQVLDGALEEGLNRHYAPGSDWFVTVEGLCHQGIEEGWLCQREAGGIRYGRAIRPGPDSGGYSVDVVHMNDVVGPHHRHPAGEIDLVMPIDPEARFDGRGAGWVVYGPDSAHHPTVTGGAALVLYLLPEGAIEFTGG